MTRLTRRLFAWCSSVCFSVWEAAGGRRVEMPRDVRRGRAATGHPELLVGGECGWNDFPGRARSIARHFRMTVLEKIDGPDIRMWITRIGPAEFCISWDHWFAEVSVMAWHDTPPNAVERLLAVAKARA